MEPGEGSAAPKATVALPGTDVNPAGRAPARLAVHCNLATGGPGAAMRHAPFGRPRHPLGTFPCGKVPRPPAGGRNLPQETGFLWEARKGPSLYFPVLRRISPLRRRPKGFPVALWKPSGFHPLRGMEATKNGFFVEGRGKPRLAFLVLHRVSLLHGNYDQTVNNRQEINKTAKFVDFSASPRDQSIARGWQKFL